MPFADIAGHERVVEMLQRAVRRGKTSHSYIFEGPVGCGRRKTALALIQTLFCPNADSDACGVCPPCRKVGGNNHADIHLIEPLPDKRDISIEQLREMQREVALRPYEAPCKACIIEPAERMSLNAANSLLKTLEEPPGNAIIILLTENAEILLPTIRSRCQILRFSPLSPENVRALLEKEGMEADTAAQLAPLANGSMQRAHELDNDDITRRRQLLLDRVGALDPDRVVTIFTASEELGRSRDETLDALDSLIALLRDTAHLCAGSTDIVNEAVRPALEAFAARWRLDRTLAVLDDTLETRRAVQRNANTKLALDRLFMRIAAV
jgi:DNA polymerase-3 subunit delta'